HHIAAGRVEVEEAVTHHIPVSLEEQRARRELVDPEVARGGLGVSIELGAEADIGRIIRRGRVSKRDHAGRRGRWIARGDKGQSPRAPNPRRRGAIARYFFNGGAWTVMTGTSLFLTTCSATLPIRKWDKPLRPCVPMTTNAGLRSSIALSVSPAGSPERS